jgi:hypothetical protein
MSDRSYAGTPYANLFSALNFQHDLGMVRKILDEHPRLKKKVGLDFLCEAARRSMPEIIIWLAQNGWDVNHYDGYFSVLSSAITNGKFENAKCLLELGADPNLDCPLFAVAGASNETADLVPLAQLLLDYNANINQVYIVDNEQVPDRTPLDRAEEMELDELAAFLRSKGALRATDLSGHDASLSDDLHEVVSRHFAKIGPVEPTSYSQIVSPTQIVVRIMKDDEAGLALLFTEGLSRHELKVPEGKEAFRFAELMLYVPIAMIDPKITGLDPTNAWPVQWMFKIATYTLESGDWFGESVTSFADEELLPLGPGTSFTAWMLALASKKDFRIPFGAKGEIRMYKMFPLYSEEYLLFKNDGFDALYERCESVGLPEYIDVKRKNLVASSE